HRAHRRPLRRAGAARPRLLGRRSGTRQGLTLPCHKEGVPMMPATIATPARSGPPRNLLWTVDQFHYLGDLGMFEGRRAMLIDGVIIEEGPMNPPQARAATKTEALSSDTFGRGWTVRVAKPLVLGLVTDPQPDIAVLPGKPGDYTTPPTTAALVVEVADSSLSFDTTTKAEWYATAN